MHLLRTFLFILALALSLPWLTPATAQAQNDEPAQPVITTSDLLELRESLREGILRVAPMIEAVDPGPATDWLEASPMEHLTARLEASGEGTPSRSLWQAALEHEQAGGERIRGALDRAALAASTEDRLVETERRIQEIIDSRRTLAAIDADRSLTRIEQDLAAAGQRRSHISLEIDQKRQTLERLDAQMRTQEEDLEQVRQGLAAELDTTPWGPLEEATLVDGFEAWEQARERRAAARIIAAQLDRQTLGPRTETLRLEIGALEAERQWLAQRLQQLAAEMEERAGEELRALRDEIGRLTERDPEAAVRFASEIQTLYQRIERVVETQSRVRELQSLRERHEQLERELTQTLASIRERQEIGGLTDVLGGLLMEEERRLRRLGDLSLVLRNIERELAQSRLRDITLRDELRALPPPPPEMVDDMAQSELRRLQREVIESQLRADEQLTEQLQLAESRLRAVVQQVDELSRILREALLWWPSHSQVGIEWSQRVPAAVMALLDPASWQEFSGALHAVTIGGPAGALATLLVAGLLMMWGRRVRSHLARLAEMTTHRFTDRIGLTFQAIGWSLLRVLPIPVLLVSTGFRIEQIPDIGPGVEILALVLFSAALWWVVGHLFLLFTSKNGVGMAHLDWNPLVVQRLRRHLAWYLPAQLLLIVFLALTFGHPSELVADVFGRAGLLAATLFTGVFAWRMLAPRTAAQASERQERRRRLVRIALTLLTLVLVGLVLSGYLLTVGTLLGRIINTVIVVAGVWLGFSLAERALVLSETRLMIRRMREQRAKNAAVLAGSAAGEGAVLDIPEPHLSVENINQQTMILLRVTAGAALALGILWVWADILPALTWLDGVTLWSRTIVVGETEFLSRVSLQDFLLAVFLGMLFTLAARNLPGLMEIVLSRSTLMDAAGRYTVTTLLRYVLAVVAVISVFSLLGLRWSELQWMVAALTLGLGFGLQEVVANFVSGLIMLFERPVRVGDTITIGEFSGTVARIRTRATTIVDWDNREIVIPNKSFITERLINWTLSDTMTRVVIPVGVSYDADVDEVIRTLQTIAEASPLVLKEPPPNVLFLKFGDSALNFELRTYVNQMKDRLVTISDLHQTIIKEFRSKGIEIAYPQMDLHIRDVAAGGDPVASSAPPQAPASTDPRPAD